MSPLTFVVLSFGLVLGSFLNVVAARVPAGRSIAVPGSSCRTCESPIHWYDNIPLLSYAVLRGRCRGCRTAIGAVYPAVELATGALLACCVVKFGFTPEAALAGFFCAVLVVLSAIDLAHRIVPNKIVIPAAAVVLVGHTAIDPSPEWAIAAAAAFLGMLLLALAYPRGMGMGDVKFALLLGAALGRTVPMALLLGVCIALVPTVVLFARHGVAARKKAIPLVPFLSLGALIALFFGDRLLHVYLGFV